MSPVISSSAAAVGWTSQSAERQPVPRIHVAAARMRAHALERLGERLHALEPHVAPRERPGREVDVRVREPGHDAASAEVDHLRSRERDLVHADAARNPVARDRERARDGQRGVQGADEAVFQDHARRL